MLERQWEHGGDRKGGCGSTYLPAADNDNAVVGHLLKPSAELSPNTELGPDKDEERRGATTARLVVGLVAGEQ